VNLWTRLPHHPPPDEQKAFPFDKMVPGMMDPEMIEDTAKIVNEAIKDKVQVYLIINNRASGNAPLGGSGGGGFWRSKNLLPEYTHKRIIV